MKAGITSVEVVLDPKETTPLSNAVDTIPLNQICYFKGDARDILINLLLEYVSKEKRSKVT